MQFCTQCHRAGPDVGQCGSFLSCPKEAGWVEVDPTKHVVISCPAEGCGKTVCVTAHEVVTGEAKVEFACRRSTEACMARVVLPEAEAVEVNHRGRKPKLPVEVA